MGETILDGTGSGFLAAVSSDNRLLVEISGATINIGSVSANVDSIYVQSGNNMHLGSAWSRVGSVLVSNFGDLGSDVTGSVAITNFAALGSNITGSIAQATDPWRVTGSINLFGIGSFRLVPGSLEVFQTTNSDMQVQATQGTTPWATSGTSTVAGSVVVEQVSPIDASKNNPAFKFEYQVSGTAGGTIGSRIGSIVQFIGTGSFVNVFTYANDRITNIGSWS